MSRRPKPWWRKQRQAWYVKIDGKQYNLGPDRAEAEQTFHQLMAQPKKATVQAESVLAIMDTFLEWTKKHRAPRTYDWYVERCQSFAIAIPKTLTVVQLKPLHIQQWLDQHANWNDGNRRGGITAVQRVFRWAMKMGYIDKSPIAYIEKPRGGKRDEIVTTADYEAILNLVNDQPFRDVLETAWETGCRPQEITAVQAAQVDLKNGRWVFAPKDAKVKTRPRIVYLPDKAKTITERLLQAHPTGHLFRNTKGRPWTAMAVNCRFNKLKKKLGRKYCLYLFRHSFATRLLEAGVDALTVAILLGHANPAMLSTTYQHLAHNPQFLLEQARKASD